MLAYFKSTVFLTTNAMYVTDNLLYACHIMPQRIILRALNFKYNYPHITNERTEDQSSLLTIIQKVFSRSIELQGLPCRLLPETLIASQNFGDSYFLKSYLEFFVDF